MVQFCKWHIFNLNIYFFSNGWQQKTSSFARIGMRKKTPSCQPKFGPNEDDFIGCNSWWRRGFPPVWSWCIFLGSFKETRKLDNVKTWGRFLNFEWITCLDYVLSSFSDLFYADLLNFDATGLQPTRFFIRRHPWQDDKYISMVVEATLSFDTIILKPLSFW